MRTMIVNGKEIEVVDEDDREVVRESRISGPMIKSECAVDRHNRHRANQPSAAVKAFKAALANSAADASNVDEDDE